MPLKRSFLLILVASAFVLSAASPNLNPSPRPAPKPNESATLRNQQGQLEVTPLGVSNLPQSSKQAGASTKEQQDGSDAPTTIIAVFTVVAGLATAAIAKFNWQLVSVTKEMKKAAEAALDVNRPFLLVTNITAEVKHADYESAATIQIRHNFYFKVAIKNFGVSPADIIDYTAVAEPLNPPRRPTFIDPVVWYENVSQLNDSIISPGESVPDRINPGNGFTDLEYRSLLADEKRLAIYGRIRYRGASQKVFETFFYWWCFLTEPDRPQLLRCNTKKWNDHT